MSFKLKPLYICILTGLVLGAFGIVANAAFNEQINFQGKLTDNDNQAVSDDDYNFEFKLWNHESTTTASYLKWTETCTSTNDKITVTSGLFSHLLGSVNSLSDDIFNQTLWLEVSIAGTTTNPTTTDWETLNPRKKLGAVPTAFEAKRLGGKLESAFGTLGEDETITGAWTFNNILSATASSSSAILTVNQTGSGNLVDFQVATSSKFVINNSGEITTGEWKATAIGTQWGGTGQDWSSAATGSVPYFSTQGEMGLLPSEAIGKGPTLIVAATTSIASSTADYVCDGTSDQVEINAALNALPTGGGRVMLLEGTFTIDDPITFPANNITLEGQGRSTFIDGDGLATTEHGIVINSRDDSVVRNLAIQTQDGGGKTSHCIFVDSSARIVIDGVTIVNSDSNGIHFEDVYTMLYARNSTIIDADGDGIHLASNNNDFAIYQNYIQNVGGSGILLHSAGYYENGVISDNVFRDTSGTGIDIGYLTRGVIANNSVYSFYGAGANGIRVGEGERITIVGNAIYGGDNHGIEVNSANAFAVTGNVVEGVSNGHCIYVHDSFAGVIAGNTCYSSGANGIDVYRSDNTNIIGNLIYGVGSNDDGIKVYDSLTDNNLVSSNQIYDSSGSQYGINISGTNAYLIGNEISGAGFTAEINDAGTNTTIQQRDWFEIEQTSTSSTSTALTVTQSGSGNIVEFLDATTTVFTIADGGNITVAGDILPATTTAYDLGSDTYKWANLYAATATFDYFKMATGATSSYVLTSDASGVGTWQAAAGGADTDWIISGSYMYATTSVSSVGIGTSTQAAILDVYASSTASALTVTQGSNGNIVEFKDSAGTKFSLDSSGNATLASGFLTTPYGGLGRYQNLLRYSEEFDNSVWATSNVAVTADATTSPNGQTTADQLQATTTSNYIEQSYDTGSALTNRTFTLSVWLKATTTVTSQLKIYSATSTAATTSVSITTSWQRFFLTATFGTDTATTVIAQIIPVENATGSVYAWGAQLEEESGPGVYARTISTEIATTTRGAVGTPAGPTLIVAASDSKNVGRADYVCDGTDDHVQIQAALDALPSGGGEVRLLEGTYYIESSIILNSSTTLRGAGKNTILTTQTANLDIITVTGSSGDEKTGILIADLVIDGDAGGTTNDGGIFWSYVDYSKIEGVWSQDNGDEGIGLNYCDFNTIIANICQGNNYDGIWLYGSDNNTVSANICQGNDDSGIFLYDSDNNTISDNICQGNDDNGIYLYGPDSDNNIVNDNICQGNNDYGIHLYDSDNNIVSDNICQGNGYDGIYLGESDNNTVSDNICQGNDDDGIYLYDSDNNTVSDNICQGNSAYGIFLDESDNNTVSDNICLENSQSADNTHDNIYLSSSDYNLIEGNLCRAPTIGTTLTVGEPIAETEIAVTNTAGFEVGMGVVIDLGGVNVEYHRISAITAGAPGVITIDAGLTNAQGAGETIDVPEAQYGINISNATSDKNMVVGNDLYDAGATADLNDAGTGTIKSNNRTTNDFLVVANASSTAVALTVTQSGSGNIVEFIDATTTVFTIADGGNVTVAGDILPATTTTHDLGSSTYKWANLYAVTTTIGDTITIGGSTFTGSGTTTLSTNAGSLILNPSGNVGIGTTNPAYKLDVAGTLAVTGGTTIYDFTDTTNNKAYATTSGNDTPLNPGDAAYSEYTPTNYTAVNANDSSRNVWGGIGGWTNLWYKFKINESVSNITQIDITWIGYDQLPGADDFELDTWNVTNSVWDQWYTTTTGQSSDQTYTKTYTSGFSNYINGSGYFQVGVSGSLWGGCFLAGTKITMADGSYRNIEDMEVGDVVLSYDEISKSLVNTTVTRVYHHSPEEMGEYYLIINNKVKVLPIHLIYVNEGWKPAGSIKVGDILLDEKGNSEIVSSIEKVYEKVPVFNLHTEEYHNYFASGILAHNGKSPFIYSSDGSNYIFETDILAGFTSKEKENISYDVLAYIKKPKIKLTNELHEIDYIDSLRLRVTDTAENDKRTSILNPISIDNASLDLINKTDENYLVLKEGDEYYIEFEPFPELEEGYKREIGILASGYYELLHSIYENYIKVEVSYTQLSVRHDADNRLDTTISSSGAVTFNAFGSGAAFTFYDPTAVSASSTSTALTVTQSGSGNIVEFLDATTTVFTIADGGNVTVAGDILPATTTTYDLGSSTYKWANLYTATATLDYFKMATGATSSYVLTSDASGVGTWQETAAGGVDTDWIISGSYMYATTSVSSVGIGTSTQAAILDVYASSTASALTVTQSGSGNIAEFKDATTTVFTIADGGNVTVAGHILPATTTTYDLGSDTYKWANLYAATTTIGGTITIGGSTFTGSGTTTISTNAGSLILNPAVNAQVLVGTTTLGTDLDMYSTVCPIGHTDNGDGTCTGTFYTTSSDGYLYATSTSYATVHEAATGTVDTSANYINLGQSFATSTVTLRPNAAGTYTEFEDESTTTVAHWELVDEETADDGATWVGSDVLNARDTYNLTDSGISTDYKINSVKVYVKAKSEDVVDDNFWIMIRSGTTDATSTLFTDITDNWDTYYSYTWTTDPNTSEAWTVTAVDALEAGARVDNSTSGGCDVTQVYVEVEYAFPYEIDRAGLFFDTSILSDDVTISSGILSIHGRTVTLRPNAAGTYTQFTDLIGAYTHWQAVDEETADDATTHVGSDTGSRDTFNLTDSGLTSGTLINSVTVYVKARREGTGDDDFYIMIRSGSTDADSSRFSNIPSSWEYYSYTWTTDPNTDQAWTVAAVDALEAGGKIDTGCDITQVYVEVDYVLNLTSFDITVVDGSVLETPMVSADYGDLKNATTSGGSLSASGFSTSSYNDITLNSTGIGWISKTGTTKFGLRSSRDISNTTSTENEYVNFWANEKGTGYKPKLTVSYYTTSTPSYKLYTWGDFGVGTTTTPTLYVDSNSGRVIINTLLCESGHTDNGDGTCTATFYASSSDGFLYATSSSYSATHEAATGTVNASANYLKIGQLYSTTTLILRPNATGTYTEFEDMVPTSTHWELVDEETADDDTTHVGSDIEGSRDTFNLTDSGLSGVSINSVKVYTKARREGPIPGDDDFYIMIRSGTTDATSTLFSNIPSSWEYYSYTWTTDPNTGQAWTASAVDALEAGGMISTGCDITQVYVVVEYISSYEINRGGLFFDTSSLPDEATILIGTLSIVEKTNNFSTVTLRPNATGTYTEFEDLTGADTHWQAVDEETADDATTHVGSDVSNARDTFNLTDSGLSAGTPINSVTVYVKARREGTDDDDFYIMIRSGTADVTSPLISNAGDTWLYYSYTQETDPNTGQSWTIAAVDALEAGGKIETGCDITQVYVEVEYISFDITVVDGSVLETPMVSADYGDLKNATTSGGSLEFSVLPTLSYNDITLNSTGIGWISKTGTTKFGLRSSRDISNTTSTENEYVNFWANEKGTIYKPKLTVSYSPTTMGTAFRVGGERVDIYKHVVFHGDISVTGDAPVGGLAIFGDGSDGDVTISSNATCTRDMFYNNLTIYSGITLNTGGYRIFVKETLTNNGTIERNGADEKSSDMTEGTLGGGKAGGGNQEAGTNADPSLGGNGGAGGGGIYAGGTATAAKSGGRALASAILGWETEATAGRIQGGAGGGGSSNPVGGQGGGVVIIAAKTLNNSSGTISANGGAGGGDSGGGGGGCILLVYNSLTAGTETATGGAGAGTGANGSNGKVIKIANK